MRSQRVLAAVCATSALVAAGASLVALAPESAASQRSISDAILQWGVNPESGGGAYLPGSCNFLSAGVSPDALSSHVWAAGETGAAGAPLYRASDGNVQILKPDASGTYSPATWDTKCTNRYGTNVSVGGRFSTRSGRSPETQPTYSENVARFLSGSGTLDPATNSAHLEWSGSFTIVYYSGMSYWSISNPVLDVSEGVGTLSATASGFASNIEDSSLWNTVASRRITLATFQGVSVGENGLSATPDYLGVSAPASADAYAPQVERSSDNAAYWGSFPQDWVNFNVETGQSSYWYTSGAQAIQERKVASPITVSVGGAPDSADDPAPSPTDEPSVTPTPEPSAEPTPAPTSSPAAGGTLSGVSMRWAMSNEANAGAFNGDCNFLSAGSAGNTGSSRLWDEGMYSSSQGNVRIVKADGKGGWMQASWATHCLDASGNKVSSARVNSHSGSQVVISEGSGSVGADGSLHVQWEGAWTVAFYGGMTYWSAVNPTLDVDANGNGRLSATVSGYGSDRDDTSRWIPLAPRTLTLANLSGINVQAALAQGGFTVDPTYVGVSVQVAGTPQSPRTASNEKYWGSFPQDFVNFQVDSGQSSYWYTSGGARDEAKVASPLTIGFTASFVPPASTNAGVSTAPAVGVSRAASGAKGAGASSSAASGSAKSQTEVDAPKDAALSSLPSAVSAGGYEVRTASASSRRESAWRIAAGSGVLSAGTGLPLALAWLIRRQLGLDPGMIAR